MEKFSNAIEKHVAPMANKIARQKYIQALQSTFLSLIPFMTIGSFALIIISPAADYTTMDVGFLRTFFQGWQSLADFTTVPLGLIYNISMGCMSLYVTAGLGLFLAKHYKLNNFISVILTLISFLIMSCVTKDGTLSLQYFDGKGLFTSILVSIITVELYRFLTNKKFGRIELSGGGVPPALTDSLAALAPSAVILLLMGILSSITLNLTGDAFPGLMTLIMTPLVSMIDSVWGVLILAVIVMLLWWFGIHDTVITGPLTPFLVTNFTTNSAAYAAGTAAISLPYILTEPFWWTFMAIGGSGATLGLAFLALRSKSKQIRTVGKLCIIPSLFNINEPLIFGLPLMFNPVMMFPFVFTMAFNGVITYLAMDFHLIGRTFADPSWNMFAPIGAILSTMDVKALFLVIGLIVVDLFIYLPFFKIYEKQKMEEERLEEELQENQNVALEE
ncbi:PTS sugar transporter subunit IIC [Enterococcus sp. DIV0756]|uniref:PTS sugar transporter subunit IIC n=1 Tax=Enterococcus sp. DIV0756 TaxID=2774636 RepID=UPI003F22365A